MKRNRVRLRLHAAALLAATLLAGGAAPARDAGPAPDDCLIPIAAEERAQALPTRLLITISTQESGRLNSATRTVAPWPWTIDVAGVGHFFATKQDAIAAVQVLQATGIRSIDVGCMQINLLHHPGAFASLDEAFDPATNIRYGARFLNQLRKDTGGWEQAIAAYHSRTPAIGTGYAAQILARWGMAPLPIVTPAAVRRAVAAQPAGDHTAEFATQLREAAEDHRRNLAAFGAGPAGAPAPRKRPERLRLAEFR